jgi:hypothetical protein
MPAPRLSLLCLAVTLPLATACRTAPKDDGGGLDGSVDGLETDEDGDGVPASDDCDDGDASVGPDAEELCNGIDDNCDGQIDEGVTATFWPDADDDGFGAADGAVEACDLPDGFVANAEDCDDADDEVFPGATEVCNGADDDCDSEVDEGVGEVFWTDADGDGYGDPEASFVACDGTADGVANDRDCDDTDPTINPDGLEVCNEKDDDCDGTTDEGVTTTFYADTDGDAFGDASATTEACEEPAGYAADPGDCDDSSAAVFPGATELCNGADDDCDGTVDEADAADATAWHADADSDGYGDPATATVACDAPSGHVADNTDCDDTAFAVNPGATEVCNGIDDDCDLAVDDDDTSVDLSTGSTWYADSDGDSYGNAAATTLACDAPANHVSDSTDCDDGETAVNPGATEVCNELDDDCDGLIDDADTSLDTSTGTTFYEDADGDGYGTTASALSACEEPTGYASLGGDCDDSDTDYNPGAALGCDGEDYDCDGNVDSDDDLDGYADEACGGDDCDDDDASIRPDTTGDCALGLTCADILDEGRATTDGDYFIDPDGYATGLDPFEVYCDMTTDGGGWTEIAYDDDLDFQQWFTSGDQWQYQASDFSFELSDAQIAAVQALSVDGYQEYEGRCEHVIHYYYTSGATYGYAFGFMFFDGTETPRGSSSYSPYNITVSQDGCASNGGEGGALADATVFEIDSALVPVLNVQCRDCGNTFPEYFGSDLTDNPAWLR